MGRWPTGTDDEEEDGNDDEITGIATGIDSTACNCIGMLAPLTFSLP